MKYKVLSASEYLHKSLKLTAIDSKYIQLIREWRNSQISILRQNQFISEEQQNIYFLNKVFPLFDSSNPEQILFNIFYEGKFIGYGGIVHISYDNKTGEISFLLNPSIEPDEFYESVFHDFLVLMDKVAFIEMGLNKLYTETFSSRSEHISMLENAGYIREGVRQSHLIINNHVADIYLHGRFADSIYK